MTFRLLLILLVCVLAACSTKEPAGALSGPPVLDVELEPVNTPIAAGKLLPGHQFGQTFLCRHNGLTKIQVLVATYAETIPTGTLNFHLRSAVQQSADIANASIPASSIKDNTYVALECAPIPDSAGKTYYFFLESRGVPEGYAFTVWTSYKDVYAYGDFFRDGQPERRDLAFRTYCRPRDP